MTRLSVGRSVASVAAVGFLATAWLHSTGYDSVTELAASAPADLKAVAPALWLSFSFDLVVVGLIVAAVAWRPSVVGRVVLVIAALCPFSAAALQLRFIGFVPPTAILLVLGVVTLGAATVLPSIPTKKQAMSSDDTGIRNA